MGLSRLDMLYRQVVLDHSNSPRHYGLSEDMTHQLELNNPTCGDVITLQLKIEEDRVVDARFAGSGCSISMASASMMTEVVIGKTEKEAMALAEDFSELVQGKEVANIQALGDASLLKGVSKFPARIKCATLAWKALERGIIEKEAATTAEQSHCEEKE
ncbi:Fe-S cluster assembly sulfur transfer protein SufU [Vagococcus xieshaowenii]|uniref:SUF system NifU family Fe-S cluster assembly protein n=1 Tax=Vagococcus xieshaowenii TaxID=2562451 RepID=A0AAJ5JMU5_9ENTE|nr:SUF system NifU family Fe-S cluster assembly protein [Vagococcus xieshaowenii]QCA28882.1 SUF system NifU family Fe-S cluster assembly protein [Vagococcus xieshaowenii]TFZ43300.1 SUF system NifU family Fe-S cluster assembly protein [Vagococcus xieshaowenii]